MVRRCSLLVRTRTTEDANQFGRASAVVADGNDIAQCTPLILSDRLEDIDEIISSATTGKHDNAFGPGRDVVHGRGGCSRREEGFKRHDDDSRLREQTRPPMGRNYLLYYRIITFLTSVLKHGNGDMCSFLRTEKELGKES